MVPQLGNTPVTAFQAVTEAGGLLPFADKKRSYILRNNGLLVTRVPVKFDKIEEGKEPDVPLNEGDTIIIPQKVLGF
jgi:protein involved in polysaccharide export with SLBB domain